MNRCTLNFHAYFRAQTSAVGMLRGLEHRFRELVKLMGLVQEILCPCTQVALAINRV